MSKNVHAVEKIGTVDIMQGQDIPVVAYDVTTTDVGTLGERADWLFQANRWNMALSRAKCATFILCRTDKLEAARPKTIKRLVALQRIRSLLKEVQSR